MIGRSSLRASSLSGSVEIYIAEGFAGGRILGFFHGFFELFGEDVFLVRFLEEGIGEFVFALPLLFFKDVRSLGEINVGSGLYRSAVREDRAEDRIDDQLGLAARASDVEIFAVFASHGDSLLQKEKESDVGDPIESGGSIAITSRPSRCEEDCTS